MKTTGRTEIEDNDLFNMGVHYIKQKITSEGFQINEYQEPPFVPQFIVKKANETYFLYIKLLL